MSPHKNILRKQQTKKRRRFAKARKLIKAALEAVLKKVAINLAVEGGWDIGGHLLEIFKTWFMS